MTPRPWPTPATPHALPRSRGGMASGMMTPTVGATTPRPAPCTSRTAISVP